jgi:hypothetical protein
MTAKTSRRGFLSICGNSALAVSGMTFSSLGLGGLPSGCNPTNNPDPINVKDCQLDNPFVDQESINYYSGLKATLLDQFDMMMPGVRHLFRSYFTEQMIDTIMIQARNEYETLIVELPYIGGRENYMTQILIQSAVDLAVYRVLKSHGIQIEDIGNLIYEKLVAFLYMSPKGFLRLWGRFTFTQIYLSWIKLAALKSQERHHPGDWVYTFVDGDGETFDYGMDFTECAIRKFFHVQCADELTPYMCAVDYATSEAYGQGMMRTQTLAEGGEKCDFRYKWEGWEEA